MPRHVPQTTSIHLEPHQIVLRPLVTEKGMHRSTRNNAYAFEVKVLKVHIQNRKGKPRRTKFHLGHTATWKKAIVSLDPEHRIDFF